MAALRLRREHDLLWFSDLRGYTRISDSAPPDTDDPAAQRLCGCDHSSVHEAGGDVLKLIGDGILAIFHADAAAPPAAARSRPRRGPRRIAALNQRRAGRAGRHGGLSRPAYRRGVLRQYRQRGPARLHRGRPRGERGQPDRLDVPLGRPRRAAVLGVRRRRDGGRSRRLVRSAATRCAVSASRRSSTRWIPRHSDTHHGIIGSLNNSPYAGATGRG